MTIRLIKTWAVIILTFLSARPPCTCKSQLYEEVEYAEWLEVTIGVYFCPLSI